MSFDRIADGTRRSVLDQPSRPRPEDPGGDCRFGFSSLALCPRSVLVCDASGRVACASRVSCVLSPALVLLGSLVHSLPTTIRCCGSSVACALRAVSSFMRIFEVPSPLCSCYRPRRLRFASCVSGSFVIFHVEITYPREPLALS